jgi:hypothetical protein
MRLMEVAKVMKKRNRQRMMTTSNYEQDTLTLSIVTTCLSGS